MSCRSKAKGKCGSSLGKNASMEQSVRTFLKEHGKFQGAELEHFKSGSMDLKTAIRDAGMANIKGRKCGHQHRLNHESLKKGTDLLMKKTREIDSMESFDGIYSIVGEVVRQVAGLGELYHYDTSLRIGWFKGLRPNQVFLQSGSLEGARRLNLVGRGQRTIAVEDVFQRVPAMKPLNEGYLVEDFLCACKDCFTV